jgi:hypothetical protein
VPGQITLGQVVEQLGEVLDGQRLQEVQQPVSRDRFAIS